jgi:hypothetical protein
LIVPVVIAVAILFLATAKDTKGVQGTANQGSQQAVASPTGNQVTNQNQIKTKNQGEEQELQVENQEEENLGTGSGTSESRNQKANEHMSAVAAKVQELLQIRTSGGIGEQVREVARLQNQAQEQIQTDLGKVQTRSSLMKALIGTDYGATKRLEAQLEQNQLRIEQLEQLMTQLYNQGDITMVQETIQALIQENTSLQEVIAAENQVRSMFGWLFRWFAR